MLTDQREHRRIRRADWLVAALLLCVAVLCHARYVCDQSLLFATEGDSFRQILPTSMLIQNALLAGDPFWSWSFGLGGDMFTELSYAGTTSPFTYLQFLVRLLFGAAGGNDLLAALRWKLVFSIVKQALALNLMYALLRKENLRRAYAVIGALTYGCAPWFLYRAIQFDFMTDAYVLLPLVMLCYARYRQTGKWMLLSVSIAVYIGTNLYFGYIGCLFLAPTFLLFSSARIGGKPGIAAAAGETPLGGCDRPMEPGTSPYCARVGRLVGVAVLGALLAAVCLLPSVNAILSSDRTVANAQLLLLPRLETLKNLPATLFFGNGMFALPMMGLLAFALRWRDCAPATKKRTLLAALWLVLLLIPATASMMNGFSYETPRWHFVVIFAVAYALPYWLSELEAGHARLRPWAVWALCAVLIALYALLGDKTLSVAGLARAASFVISLCCLPWVAFRARIMQKPLLARVHATALVACVLICGALNSVSVRVHNLYAEEAQERFFGSQSAYAANVALIPGEGEFYRVHDTGVDTHEEDAEARPFVYGYSGISNYASELDGRVSEWMKRTFRFRTTPVCAGIYQSFDDRLFADIAWDVRYKVPGDGGAGDLPSNWTPVTLSNGATAYESALSTGFALWYDTAVSVHAWLQADVAMRDAMLLQTAALEQELAYDYPSAELDDVTAYLPNTFADADVTGGVWANDGTLVVEDEATLRFAVPRQAEEGEYLMCFSIRETSGEESFAVTAGGRKMDKFADTLASESLNYPLTDYAFRYSGAEPTLEMTLTKGVYELWDLLLAFNSYARVADWVEQRNRYNFDALSIDGSRIAGTITVGERGILALSMPFNEGWRCTLDGKRAPLLTVNGLFAGIALTPGTHVISMRFVPPYLILGAGITLITALGLVAVNIVCRRRRGQP